MLTVLNATRRLHSVVIPKCVKFLLTHPSFGLGLHLSESERESVSVTKSESVNESVGESVSESVSGSVSKSVSGSVKVNAKGKAVSEKGMKGEGEGA